MRHDPDNLRPLEGTALCTWPTCGCTDNSAFAVCPDYSVTHGMRARINAGHAPEGRGRIRTFATGLIIGALVAFAAFHVAPLAHGKVQHDLQEYGQ